ncbi:MULTISPECIES: hypothetical protein [unclassified Aureispira]|uniref:hypothetical protein n=1 Tax=unclassified Aureispira TaxID=2649989 RepID=UPI00069873A1|nr:MULTISPECIES: hypothetical protein [unclassified Aureispira]WMX14695.1 hypothetical protein QP953_27950 [Aureispira sp. CCB-E]
MLYDNMLHFFNALLTVTELSMFIAGVTVCYYLKQLSHLYKLIGSYIGLSILVELLTTYFMSSTGYNLFLLPVYSFAELAIFSTIYLCFFFEEEKSTLRNLLLLAHGLIILDILFLCDLFNAETFYAFSKVVADIAIILLCLRYYWTILKEKTPIDKERLLLNSMFIGYFSINSIIFLSINFLVNESLYLVTPFWMLNALSALLLYSFLTYMIWQHGKTQKTSPYG